MNRNIHILLQHNLIILTANYIFQIIIFLIDANPDLFITIFSEIQNFTTPPITISVITRNNG